MTQLLSRHVLWFALALLVSACGVAADTDTALPGAVESQQSASGLWASEHDEANLTDAIPTDPNAAISCSPCYVKCTDAPPDACRWTSAHNIGSQGDCGTAGRRHCANLRYTYSYAGCSPRSATWPACR